MVVVVGTGAIGLADGELYGGGAIGLEDGELYGGGAPMLDEDAWLDVLIALEETVVPAKLTLLELEATRLDVEGTGELVDVPPGATRTASWTPGEST